MRDVWGHETWIEFGFYMASSYNVAPFFFSFLVVSKSTNSQWSCKLFPTKEKLKCLYRRRASLRHHHQKRFLPSPKRVSIRFLFKFRISECADSACLVYAASDPEVHLAKTSFWWPRLDIAKFNPHVVASCMFSPSNNHGGPVLLPPWLERNSHALDRKSVV